MGAGQGLAWGYQSLSELSSRGCRRRAIGKMSLKCWKCPGLVGVANWGVMGHNKWLSITIEHMQAIRRQLNLHYSFDTAVWVVACVTFWCCYWYMLILCGSHET